MFNGVSLTDVLLKCSVCLKIRFCTHCTESRMVVCVGVHVDMHFSIFVC